MKSGGTRRAVREAEASCRDGGNLVQYHPPPDDHREGSKLIWGYTVGRNASRGGKGTVGGGGKD